MSDKLREHVRLALIELRGGRKQAAIQRLDIALADSATEDGGGVLGARTVERSAEPGTHGGASTDREARPLDSADEFGPVTEAELDAARVELKPDAAPSSDAAQPEEYHRSAADLMEAIRQVTLGRGSMCITWKEAGYLLYAHPEDAPEGPYEALTNSDGWFVHDRRKIGGMELGGMVFSGSEPQCISVRDALNRLKGEKTDG